MIADPELSADPHPPAVYWPEVSETAADPAAANVRRLLLIDDQPSIHDAFRSILQPAVRCVSDLEDMEMSLFGEPTVSVCPKTPGEKIVYRIESAFQGEEGLRRLSSAMIDRERFDAAVVDMCMPPGWDGIETIRQLWNIHPDLKVIVCTAHSAYSWPDVVSLLGRSDQLSLLAKPFSKAEAIAVIESVTDR